MNHTELSVKTTINDIEPNLDKNQNLYFKLTLRGFANPFYAFSYNLPERILTILKEKPEQFTNQLALIAYEELEHQDKNGTFYKVKQIQVL